jgi:hypothetical protein
MKQNVKGRTGYGIAKFRHPIQYTVWQKVLVSIVTKLQVQ